MCVKSHNAAEKYAANINAAVNVNFPGEMTIFFKLEKMLAEFL